MEGYALIGRTTHVANALLHAPHRPHENSASREGMDWLLGGWGIFLVDRSSFLFLGHPFWFSLNRLLLTDDGRAMFTKQVIGGIVEAETGFLYKLAIPP